MRSTFPHPGLKAVNPPKVDELTGTEKVVLLILVATQVPLTIPHCPNNPEIITVDKLGGAEVDVQTVFVVPLGVQVLIGSS